MKKLFIGLILCIGFVNFTYAQKWEVGVDAGLFKNTGSNVGEGSGGNFSGVWDVNESVYSITNYKVGFFVRRNISRFFVSTGASTNFNQQIDIRLENIEPSDQHYGEVYFYGFKVQTISVPLITGIHIYKGFGFETGVSVEFDVINRKNHISNPPVSEEINSINQALNNSYWRYTCGVFYQYKRIRASFDYQRDLGWIVHEIRYNINSNNETMPAATSLFVKTNSFVFSISYSIFTK